MLQVRLVLRSLAGGLLLISFSFGTTAGPSACSAQEAERPRALGRIRANDLKEISGLAVSRRNADVLWVHNDGGSKLVFAVGTDGQSAGEVRVRLKVHDVEDIAIGPGPEKGVDYLYLGDIGDNEASRREVRVIRFVEPDLESAGGKIKAQGMEELLLRYPDGPHDAEALMVDWVTGDLFIVTKEDGRSRMYRVDGDALKKGSATTLELTGYLNVEAVSAGDISRGGDAVILRSEDRGWLWNRQDGESIPAALQRAPRRIVVRGPGQGENGEAIGFAPEGASYYTVSEGDHEAIYIFPVPAGVTENRGGAGEAR